MNLIRKCTYLFIAVFLLGFPAANGVCEEEKTKDPQAAFYMANTYYAERNYQKAAEAYASILNAGLENGTLYYNMGNCFFKMGKIGFAILFYEKARRLIPQDSDLRSNLSFARQELSEPVSDLPSMNLAARVIKRPYRDLNMNALAGLTIIFYIIIIAMAAFLIMRPFLWKRYGTIFIIMSIFFLSSLSAFALRYYDEEILKWGIVVQKEAQARYEPIDKSTAYYNLREGDRVVVLSTRNGWRQVKRADGKIAWVSKDAVEEI